MNLIKNLALTMVFLVLPIAAFAEGGDAEYPRWAVEAKGGLFYPDISDWSTYYGSNRTWDVAGAVGYKLLPQIEIGVEAGMMRDTGRVLAPTMHVLAGNVQYSLWPLTAYVVGRAKFSEDQWLVPYVGIGWTRMYYQEKIENQSTAKGSADGYTSRAGIQLLLDNLDTSAANNLYMDFGIRHTYLILEAQKSTVRLDTAAVGTLPSTEVNIGGLSFLGGFLFEF